MLCDDIGTRCGGSFVLLFFVTSAQKGSMGDIFSLKKYLFPVFLFFLLQISVFLAKALVSVRGYLDFLLISVTKKSALA